MSKLVKVGLIGAFAVALVGWLAAPIRERKHTELSGSTVAPVPTGLPSNAEYTYFQNKDGLWIFCRIWKTSQPLKGVVFLNHGLAEHTGRYEHVAKAFNDEGYTVMGIDHQGHGRSEGDRIYVVSYDDYIEDFWQFVDKMTPSIPKGTPVFLFGHSNGGIISILSVNQRPTFFKGVVLSAPGLVPDPSLATPTMVFLAQTIKSILPKLRLEHLDNNKLARDPSVKQRAQEDPLHYKGMLACNWGAEFLDAIGRANLSSIEWPFFVFYGTQDTLILPEGSLELYKQAKSKDKSIKAYEGFFHETFNDFGKEEVIKNMIDWIKQRT